MYTLKQCREHLMMLTFEIYLDLLNCIDIAHRQRILNITN